MVGAHYFGMYFGRLDFVLQYFTDEEIVYPPADVTGAGIGEVTPPAVIAITLRENAESVDEAGCQPAIEAGALFASEAFFADVWFGIG